MTAFKDSSQTQAETIAVLHPIYSALVREFVIEVPECPLEAGEASADPAKAKAWLSRVDGEIQVHQLRQFLQTTPLVNEAVLRHLLLHHLNKPAKSSADRDKVDFLLVQYFSFCAPSGLAESDVDLELVAQVLEPVLGEQQIALPAWLAPLEKLIQGGSQCHRLSDLLHSGVLEQGRKIKMEAGEHFCEPAAMVAFARFSFIIRRSFFRLMHHDLNAIQDGLRELERRGVTTIDCRRAQFSAEEPIARLRMICQSWKVMFHAEYSSGQPLRMLVDLRAAVDSALGATQKTGSPKNSFAAGAATGSPKANQEKSK